MKMAIKIVSGFLLSACVGVVSASDVVQSATNVTENTAKSVTKNTHGAVNQVGKTAEDLAVGTGKAIDAAAQGIEKMVSGH